MILLRRPERVFIANAPKQNRLDHGCQGIRETFSILEIPPPICGKDKIKTDTPCLKISLKIKPEDEKKGKKIFEASHAKPKKKLLKGIHPSFGGVKLFCP